MARPRGSKNIKSFQAEELAKKLGVDPLEIMLRYAAGDWKGLGYDSEVIIAQKDDGNETFMRYTITPETRMQAAKESARYLYSPKQAIQVSGELGLKIIVEDYLSKDE